MIFEIEATAIALERYIITAESEDEAMEKLHRGEWDSWQDLGHEDMTIESVTELV